MHYKNKVFIARERLILIFDSLMASPVDQGALDEEIYTIVAALIDQGDPLKAIPMRHFFLEANTLEILCANLGTSNERRLYASKPVAIHG